MIVGDFACAKPPNLLLIMTDDQGYGPLGRHGHPWIRTPHLDALHDASVHFERFFVNPTCAPTRAALMTGRHSLRNGITHTILERERLTLDAVTLAEVLQSAGYSTGIFGKWHLGDEDAYQPGQRGFVETFIHGGGGVGQKYPGSCADAPGNSYFDPVIRHNSTFVKSKGFCTDVFFSAAIDWIQTVSQQESPFFAYIATNAPHAPYVAPEASKSRFLKWGFGEQPAAFYGMIENIDANIGRLLAALEQQKLLTNTVIIFLSDNGMAGGPRLGSPQRPLGHAEDGSPLFPYNAGMRGLKGSPHEGGVRVPCFLRWDGRFPAGQSIDRIATAEDLFPTLAALAGADLPPDQVEGRSLLPLIENPQANWPDRMLFTHVGRWPSGDEPDDYQWKNFSVRNQRFRLVGEELFDMQADPGQQQNVIHQFPDIAAALRAAYDQWWQETRPLLINETAPLSEFQPFIRAYDQQVETRGIPDWQPRTTP